MALEKRYDHFAVEEGKYETWKSKGYFKCGEVDGPKFSMVIPPPNVTGKLHIGHAFNTTVQDILARYKKACGYDVLWLPGMDHAGIATQAKVDARLREQGISRYDLGREGFLKEAWKWKAEYAESIHEQWKTMGLMLDYSKERFTLDEGLSKAVNHVFVTLYNKGLIYQGERIINWDPVQMTALSNIEVIHKDDKGHFFYFKYWLEDRSQYLEVATTRPETMFGDVCVVVNPQDERYKHLIGKKVINPANGELLPLIADEYVELDFGTGVMKCTPAHDPNDFIIGEKYGFPHPICMNKDATMNELAGKYKGLDRFVCRDQLVEDIKNNGDLIKIEEIVHPVGHSERSDAVVEPYLSKQWFIKMRPLADRSLENQQTEGKVNFFPERFEKTFTSWMEKVDDWCISRQLWWGHRIPAYYHKVTGEVLVSEVPPTDIENYIQDEDVLDTWFSSALWPFTTLGWPDATEDLEKYFPIDVMVTAYDIIFFWVSRMIFQSLEFTNKAPFKDCLIHGLIRDPEGRKMSKSLGNGVDPIKVIEDYGADALRYFITTNSTPGLDSRYSDEKLQAASNYLNKIWNAARYILMNLPADFKEEEIDFDSLNSLDKFIISKLEITINSVKTNMDKYELANASTHLYNFVYDDFCSWYLEMSKVTLQSGDEQSINKTHQVLYKCLKGILMMIYPYTPFFAEEIYLNLPGHKESIMLESYPVYEEKLISKSSLEHIETLIALIKDVRSYKVENSLAPNAILKMHLLDKGGIYQNYTNYIERFTFAKDIVFESNTLPSNNATIFVYNGLEMALIDDTNVEELLAKLDEEIKMLESEVARSNKMLSNPGFLAKAPEAKINTEKEKLQKYLDRLNACLAKKAQLSK